MPEETTEETEYDDDFIKRLTFKWGEGFLSPGGVDEVQELVGRLDLAGKSVLDFGCGLGGADIALVEHHRASTVVGVDIDAGLIARAQGFAARKGLSDDVRFQKVDPGPLPFADQSFDTVVSKDVILHIADKLALYRDFARVLRPGGWIAISDWLKAEGECSELISYFQHDLGLSVTFQTIDEAIQVLGQAGFDKIEAVDRHLWFKDLARRELEQICGPRRREFVEMAGEENVAISIAANKRLVEVADTAELRPTHLRAQWLG